MKPIQVLLRIALIILSVEAVIMLFIHRLALPISPDLEAVLDALMLTLIATPFISRYVIRPYAQARDLAEQQLAQESHRNELLLSSTDDGVFGVDSQGRTTFMNPAAIKLVGWQPDELIGRKQHEILHHTRQDGSPYPEEECPICSSYRNGRMNRVDDEVFCRKDGSMLSVEYLSNPILDQRGQLEGAVIMFRDITERRRVEQDLQRQLAELERFNRLAVGRELRMIELKREVDALLGELGRDPKYAPEGGGREPT